MSWIPGWDSIASAHFWSNVYFWASICALILLGVFEVFSHRYSERHDELAAAEQDDAQRRHDDEIARLQAATEASKNETAWLSVEAATLQNRNLELEKALSPRSLEQNLTAQALKRFSNVEFSVLSEPDPEPRRTAGQVRFMLAQAGWERFTGSLNRSPTFRDGVVVRCGPLGANREAAETLVQLLKDNDIEARNGPPMMELGSNGMLVLVGFKPVPPALKRKLEDVPGVGGLKVWGNILE